MGNVFGMDWECIDRHEGIVGTKVWARGLGIHIGPEGAKGYSPKVFCQYRYRDIGKVLGG